MPSLRALLMITGLMCLATPAASDPPEPDTEHPDRLTGLEAVLPVTKAPDLTVRSLIGPQARIEMPTGRLMVDDGDTVRYRGELYRVHLDAEHLALLGLEGQRSILLPVGQPIEQEEQ